MQMQDADWELAAAHGLSTKVVRVTMTQATTDEDGKPIIPTDEQKFPLCCDTLELGDMGAAGFPLFFEFQKQVGFLFLVLSLVYFLPMQFLWNAAFGEIKEKIAEDDTYSEIGMYSTGIFIYDPTTPVGIRFFDTNDRQQYIYWIGRLLFITVVVTLGGLILVRRNLLKMSIHLDARTFTQSDFCIWGSKMEFNDYSKDAMVAKIKEFFGRRFGVNDIEYIVPCFNIEEFFEVSNMY